MDIGKIQGLGNVGRDHTPRSKGVEGGRGQSGTRAVGGDVANISDSGRSTFDKVQALTEKLQAAAPDRADLIADAKARLESGELDDPVVYRSVAEKLLGE